jgi:hypothetical protein
VSQASCGEGGEEGKRRQGRPKDIEISQPGGTVDGVTYGDIEAEEEGGAEYHVLR